MLEQICPYILPYWLGTFNEESCGFLFIIEVSFHSSGSLIRRHSHGYCGFLLIIEVSLQFNCTILGHEKNTRTQAVLSYALTVKFKTESPSSTSKKKKKNLVKIPPNSTVSTGTHPYNYYLRSAVLLININPVALWHAFTTMFG